MEKGMQQFRAFTIAPGQIFNSNFEFQFFHKPKFNFGFAPKNWK
jgi:hypothetical protein